MPTIRVDFDVYCSCGEGLCGHFDVDDRRATTRLIVKPCDKCIAKAKDDGDSEGYDRGYGDGLKEGESHEGD